MLILKQADCTHASHMRLSIILPAYNEAAHIEHTLRAVEDAAARTEHETIVVLDHCTDATSALVDTLRAELPCIRSVQNTRPPGNGFAIMTGFDSACGDFIAVVVADGCDAAEDIPRLLTHAECHALDIVSASRRLRTGAQTGGSTMQNACSRIGCWLLHRVLRIPSTDATNSFKLYRTALLRTLAYETLEGDSTAFSLAVLLRAWKQGANLCDLPTVWHADPVPLLRQWKVLLRLPAYARVTMRAMRRDR